MKKLLLSLAIILATLSATAGNVNQDVAKHIARNFAAQKGRNALAVQAEVVYSHPMPNKRDIAFYVVNLAETGFVIVSADDVAHPVLGYGFEHPWPNETLPPQITDFFDDLAAQIETASDQEPDSETADEWVQLLSDNPQPKETHTVINPLLTTTWDQGMYYNDLCPEDPNGINGHVPAGCVAVAMAQIINYWQFPTQGRGSHSYMSNYGTLSVNYANETYNYLNMPNALNSNSSSTQINAIAQLMRDCGVSVNMQYENSASGAYAIEARCGFINYFQYSPDLSYAEKKFFSASEWNGLIQQDLNANYPVYYSGNGTSGHSFVCDGYDSNNYYHFNFGWSGQADGWFLTDAINPGNHQFNSFQAAIVGIAPYETGNIILGHTVGTSSFTIDEPIEYYDLWRHNLYPGSINVVFPCQSYVTFVTNNLSDVLVVDALEITGPDCIVYDGMVNSSMLGVFHATLSSFITDFYPIESLSNAVYLQLGGQSTYLEGFHLHIQKNGGCRMVSHIETHVDTSAVYLSWQEHGSADSWIIEYGEKDFTLGEGTTITSNNNSICIDNLVFDQWYDFYIQPTCGSEIGNMWKKITTHPDKPYWHEIITSQPSGFIMDSVGNIHIHTPEALAWFNVLGNGYHGEACHHFKDTTVFLRSDIDMGQYRWMPINYFRGTFNGGNHVISNMYINEDRNAITPWQNRYSVGMFRICRDHATILDLILYNSYVTGGCGVSALIGSLQPMDITGTYGEPGATLINVHVLAANIIGYYTVGGLVGSAQHLHAINCSSSGTLTGSLGVGGLCGSAEYIQCENSFSTATIALLSNPIYTNFTESRGGLIGGFACSNSFNNCYSSGVVTYNPDPYYHWGIGKTIGAAYGDINDTTLIHYLYGYDINTSLPLYVVDGPSAPIVSDTSVFTSTGNGFHLNSTISINNTAYTDLLDALNAWVDANNTQDNYLHWITDTAMIYDGFPMLERQASINSYFINVSANPENGGTITGQGYYNEGELCTINATANESHLFSHWTNNDIIVSNNPTYSFNVIENASYVAHFTSKPSYTISVSADPTTGGSVSGGGVFLDGHICVLTASQNEDYVFDSWTKDGALVSNNPTYSFVVTENAAFVAHFTQLPYYLITVMVEPELGGNISGGGSYPFGHTCVLTANPNTNYVFENWTKDGSVVSNNPTISFSVIEDATYIAHFAYQPNYSTIIADANPINGGIVTGGGNYENGEICTLTVNPNTGYQFIYWTENAEIVSQDLSYSFTVTGNRHLIAQLTDIVNVTEEQLAEDLTVYPNPATDKLYIEYSDQILHCELFTTVGSRVYHGSDNGTKVEIPLEALPAGLYLVRITTQNLVLTKRFVKE